MLQHSCWLPLAQQMWGWVQLFAAVPHVWLVQGIELVAGELLPEVARLVALAVAAGEVGVGACARWVGDGRAVGHAVATHGDRTRVGVDPGTGMAAQHWVEGSLVEGSRGCQEVEA